MKDYKTFKIDELDLEFRFKKISPVKILSLSTELGKQNLVSNEEVFTTKTGSYVYSWRIPTSGAGTTAISWNSGMLADTGGTFKYDPSINTTYYVENEPV